MKSIIYFSLISLLAVSCQKKSNTQPPVHINCDNSSAQNATTESITDIKKPTAAQAVLIKATLKKINDLFTAVDYKINLDTLEVNVSLTNSSFQAQKGCALGYVSVKEEVLSLKDDNTLKSSVLFSTLLQQIGHYYFKRADNTDVLAKEHTTIVFSGLDANGKPIDLVLNSLPLNILDNDINAAHLTIPAELEKYYVAELAGKATVKSLDELAHLYNLKLVTQQ